MRNPAPDYWRWIKSSKPFSVADSFKKGKLKMENTVLRVVKLTGIEEVPEKEPDVKHIPIVSLKQLSDERWNQLARMNRKVRGL